MVDKRLVIRMTKEEYQRRMLYKKIGELMDEGKTSDEIGKEVGSIKETVEFIMRNIRRHREMFNK